MQNFGHAVTATDTAINSIGSASKENAKYMESLDKFGAYKTLLTAGTP